MSEDWYWWVAPIPARTTVPWWRRLRYRLRYGTTNPTMEQLGWREIGALDGDLAEFMDGTPQEARAALKAALAANSEPLHVQVIQDSRPVCFDCGLPTSHEHYLCVLCRQRLRDSP